MSKNNFYRKYNLSKKIEDKEIDKNYQRLYRKYNLSKKIEDKEIDKNYQRLYRKYKKKYLKLKQKGSAFLLNVFLKEKETNEQIEENPAEELPPEAAEQAEERPQFCRQSSLKDIDDNNIQDCSDDLNDNCFKVDGTILFEKENFRNVINIKQGSYGTVTIYESDEGNKIAIKTFENLIDYYNEKLISKIIAGKQKNLNNILQIVPSYWYEKGDDRKIIMHGKDDDLSNIADKISGVLNKENLTEAKLYFINTVESIKKLWENGLYFCDLKLGNVLYSEKSEKKIYLADIGGIVYFNQIVPMKFFESIVEYDLIIFNNNFGLINKDNNSIRHLFGIVDQETCFDNIEPKCNIIIMGIKNGKTMYKIINDKKLKGNIKLSSFKGIFTYPLTSGGSISLINQDQDQLKLELLNNIFYSIIVFLFELLFNNFFNFDHRSSNNPDYIDNSVKDVNRKIDESELSELKKKNLRKLTNYLVQQSINKKLFLDLEANEKTFENKNIEKKFNDIILLLENIDN